MDVTARTRVLVLAVAAIGVVTCASAQSLGELARQSEARRKQVAPGKQYRNEDLVVIPSETPPVAATPAAEATESSSPAADGDGEAPDGEGADPGDVKPQAPREKHDEAYWRGRAQELKSAVERVRQDMAMAEIRVHDVGASGSSPDAGEQRVSEQSLATLRQNLQFLLEEVAAFEEKARQKKVPPEWIR